MEKKRGAKDWSFLQEYTLYDYINARFEQGLLYLYKRVDRGTRLMKSKRMKVVGLAPIRDTTFPDIKGIQFQRESTMRKAEVKFTTSIFKYHKNEYREKYLEFAAEGGCIIVLSHDSTPEGVGVDVYELDRGDFTAFCRENFDRLLNRQIRQHSGTKVWVMHQGIASNFNVGSPTVPPARQTGRWCPTENLTGFHLASGDRVLFIRTKGARQSDVNKYYRQGIIHPKWILEELYVGRVTSTIESRREYCQRKGIPYETQLWAKEDAEYVDGQWSKWTRVFEFDYVTRFTKHVRMVDLFSSSETAAFADAVFRVYTMQWSVELEHEGYQDLLEKIVELAHASGEPALREWGP